MKGTPAIYKGKIIDKKVFRAFIFNISGEKKLVESWDEFESYMQTGIWFSSRKDSLEAKLGSEQKCESEPEILSKIKSKPKIKSKSKVKIDPIEEVNDSENVIINDNSVFEVIDGA